MACVVLLASLLSTGCIIPEAPEYGAARKTPIFIDGRSIQPSLGNMLRLNLDGDDVKFQMNIRSEDAGEGLVQALFIDYKHPTGYSYYDRPVPAGTFDTEKTILEDFSLPDPLFPLASCRTFTLMVMHESDWSRDNRSPIGAPPDLVSVTWFASLGDPTSKELADCPDAATEVSKPAVNSK